MMSLVEQVAESPYCKPPLATDQLGYLLGEEKRKNPQRIPYFFRYRMMCGCVCACVPSMLFRV